MTSTETTRDAQVYNGALEQFRTDHHADYAELWATVSHATRRVQEEIQAGRIWSDVADTYRWVQDEAFESIRQLDRQACQSAETALAASRILSGLAGESVR